MKKIKLILFFFLPFLLTGCITYTELNELEVVQTLAIDYRDDTYYLIANLIEKNDEEMITRTQESSGKTIEDAVINMKIKENKKLYIAHLNLLLVTPSIIEEKLDATLEYFISKKESRNDFQVALTNDISLLKNENEEELAEKIKIVENDTGTTASIILEDFLKDLLEKESTYLPYLEQEDDSVKVNGITYIKENSITYLEKEETILWNMLQKKLNTATLDKYEILSNNTSLNYKDKTMKIEITSILEEEKENYEKTLSKKMNAMYEKYKEQGLDIFEFQRMIDRSEENEDVSYQDLKLKVEAKVKNNEKTNTR